MKLFSKQNTRDDFSIKKKSDTLSPNLFIYLIIFPHFYLLYCTSEHEVTCDWENFSDFLPLMYTQETWYNVTGFILLTTDQPVKMHTRSLSGPNKPTGLL